MSNCALTAVQVVLVFDAIGGASRTTVRTTNAGAIDVVYCAAEEADTWIVQEVGTLSLRRDQNGSLLSACNIRWFMAS